MIFLFPRWDMLIPWRVHVFFIHLNLICLITICSVKLFRARLVARGEKESHGVSLLCAVGDSQTFLRKVGAISPGLFFFPGKLDPPCKAILTKFLVVLVLKDINIVSWSTGTGKGGLFWQTDDVTAHKFEISFIFIQKTNHDLRGTATGGVYFDNPCLHIYCRTRCVCICICIFIYIHIYIYMYGTRICMWFCVL